METKLQLKHPAAKKAISMDKSRYEMLRNSLLHCLSTKGDLTHKEIVKSISEDFKKKNQTFDGSLEWNLEWVKLDMEAKNEIKRTEEKSIVKFAIIKSAQALK